MKIFDAWRPYEVQEFLFSVVNNPDYVSPPKGTCGHCRGMALEITLFHKERKQELDMGTPFDDFSEKSHVNSDDITKKQGENRQLLQTIMTECNFEIYENAWWHFSHKELKKTPKYKTEGLMRIDSKG